LDPLSDEKLIKSCLSGVGAHCRLLYERYNKLIVNIIKKRIGNPEIVRDLTQETFLRAFKRLKRYRGEAEFKNWLARIAGNLCIDHYRKSERRHEKDHLSIDDPEDAIVNDLAASDVVYNPEHQMIQKELKVIIESNFEKLGIHKETILLSLKGLGYDEISEITGVPINTVGSRIHYAKMKLRKLLKPYLKGIKGKNDG